MEALEGVVYVMEEDISQMCMGEKTRVETVVVPVNAADVEEPVNPIKMDIIIIINNSLDYDYCD